MTEPDPIAALAAQLEELRGQIGVLRTRHSEDYGQVMVLLLEVKRLGEKIDAATSRRQADEPPAPYWIGLDRAESAARLAELREWVEHVARVQWPAYMTKVPPCWPNHGEAVWELSNLMTEWHRIYDDEDNRDLQAALWYFERWLPGCLQRLGAALKCDVAGCRAVPSQRSPPRYT